MMFFCLAGQGFQILSFINSYIVKQGEKYFEISGGMVFISHVILKSILP